MLLFWAQGMLSEGTWSVAQIHAFSYIKTVAADASVLSSLSDSPEKVIDYAYSKDTTLLKYSSYKTTSG